MILLREFVSVRSLTPFRSDVEEALASGVRGISLQESVGQDTDDLVASEASPM